MSDTGQSRNNAAGTVNWLTSVLTWIKIRQHYKVPDTLYHYTTFDGLHGILRSDALWATFSRALNDGTEGSYGRISLRNSNILPARMDRPMGCEVGPASVFVTCFCEDPDLLSMWRSYSAQGGGFCLGFASEDLEQLVLPDETESPCGLVKVIYGDRLPENILNFLKSKAHSASGQWVVESMLKHNGFREEQEWRLIVPDPPPSQMTFHSGHGGIKACVDFINRFDNRKLPLQKIICGPTVRRETQTVIRWMLQKYNYPNVKVTGCEIPYRL